MARKWKVVGIDFDHMHMGDNLRMAFDHPGVEIVGICDENRDRMSAAAENFSIPADRVFTDYRECIEKTGPDFAILCPATARHGEWTEKVAPFGLHILMEKPFAASLAEADRMIAAMPHGKRLAINWPLAWYPAHVTAKRLVDEGKIGDVIEVHFYDGNRGPLWHLADKVEISKKEAGQLVAVLAETAYKEARRGFTIPGIGKLVVVRRKARMGRNPATGESIKIPAKTVLKFRIAKACKDAVTPPK